MTALESQALLYWSTSFATGAGTNATPDIAVAGGCVVMIRAAGDPGVIPDGAHLPQIDGPISGPQHPARPAG